MSERVDIILEYFPIIKWIFGGMMGMIAVLGGILWKKQQKQIKDLEIAVGQISKDTVRHVTYEEFNEFKLHIDRKFDETSKVLREHNQSVNDKLDKLVWHFVTKDKG